jgi:hypothetical protein
MWCFLRHRNFCCPCWGSGIERGTDVRVCANRNAKRVLIGRAKTALPQVKEAAKSVRLLTLAARLVQANLSAAMVAVILPSNPLVGTRVAAIC